MQVVRFFEQELGIVAKKIYRSMKMERFRIYYGNPVTGRAWDECDEGHISLSLGDNPVLIVQHNVDSPEASVILMNNIVKIKACLGGRVIYRHPRFHTHEERAPQVEDDAVMQRTPRKISLGRKRDG